MSDLAATHCDRGVGGFGDCGGILFLILILCCCGGNNSGFLGGRDCGGSNDGCGWIIFLILILCCCGNGNGFGCF
ncbi:MAG: chorion class high-cysteine HCB protein 13 [Clostridiales bacterium]|jgi:hypothetical protein|nr:chorion class high-cysteine HCB protein 13 [Bacillota bacterium]NLK03853.1 chorion class high-cysteine HCB protein 13 [Clostridiales bacterium]